VAALLVVIAATAAYLGYRSLASSSSRATSSIGTLRGALAKVPSTVWPAYGQAAFIQSGQSQVHAGPNQHAAAIASVAKVMTAYLVLRDHPLRPGQDGPTITLTDADVADTDRRRGQQESVVSIAAGEQLTERQALQALLLPSANNIAAVLARWDAGSADRFVARMSATARSLGMNQTRHALLLRPLPRHPRNQRQADDDYRGRVGPARPRPDRGRARGRRRHGRPHHRSSGCAGSTAANAATRACATKPSTTAARPTEPA